MSVHPTARTKGHTVGAGTSSSRGGCENCPGCSAETNVDIFASTPHNVNHGEDHNPHGVHKMPVHGEHIDAMGLVRADAASEGQDRRDREHDQTYGYVESVQTYQ